MIWPFRQHAHPSAFFVGTTYHDAYTFPVCSISNIDNVDLQWDTGRPITLPLPEIIRYSYLRKIGPVTSAVQL